MKIFKNILMIALFAMPIIECTMKSTIFRKFNSIRSKIVHLFYTSETKEQPADQIQEESVVEKYVPFKTNKNFNSIAGLSSAKEDLLEIITVLNNVEKYQHIKLPSGILLFGHSGNGKTTLLRTIAGETNCPVFMLSGDNPQHFADIKALSETLKKYAPCIVCIDDIDKVHTKELLHMFHEIREIKQESGKSILVFGATNQIDKIDKSLLVSGRFEQEIHVLNPDLQSRKEIISMYVKNISLAEHISIEHLAHITYGFSVLEIIQCISKAHFIALQKNKIAIDVSDFEEARDRILVGKERNGAVLTDNEKKLIAYHEAGHTIIQILMPSTMRLLHKVTIIPRNNFLGATWLYNQRDRLHIYTKETLEAEIMIGFGGHAAEEIIFKTVTNGATSDFMRTTALIKHMITKYGMSETIGKIFLDIERSEHLAKIIDKEMQKFAKDYYQKTKQLLVDNRDKLDLLATKLLEKETLYADEIYQLLGIQSPVKII